MPTRPRNSQDSRASDRESSIDAGRGEESSLPGPGTVGPADIMIESLPPELCGARLWNKVASERYLTCGNSYSILGNEYSVALFCSSQHILIFMWLLELYIVTWHYYYCQRGKPRVRESRWLM